MAHRNNSNSYCRRYLKTIFFFQTIIFIRNKEIETSDKFLIKIHISQNGCQGNLYSSTNSCER